MTTHRPQGWHFPGDSVPMREHLEELRRTDLQNNTDRLAQLELRLQQRFDAQERGVTTAMLAAEKAVNAALTASEKAVEKAEIAQSLRNAQQNEWRGSLDDLGNRMWLRTEGLAALDSLRREVLATLTSLSEQQSALQHRLDTMEGGSQGQRRGVSDRQAAQEQWRGAIAIGISLLSIAVILVLFVVTH